MHQTTKESHKLVFIIIVIIVITNTIIFNLKYIKKKNKKKILHIKTKWENTAIQRRRSEEI